MKIGLSQRIFYHKGRAYDALEHSWYQYLQSHTLVFIANNELQDFDSIAREIDLFIITGGDDSQIRRITEISLAKTMITASKPVLGVCHGCFLLADLLGSNISHKHNHRDTEHCISYNGKSIMVNSFHDLYIQTLHSQARCLVTDTDGDCEAWIDGTLAGVVWHPERMIRPWLPDEIHQLTRL